MPRPLPDRKPNRPTTKFEEFKPYEDGRNRRLRFDVNALADFEQETGMGFAQLMKQKALFGAARAMLWAGLKHEDRGLTVERVGELLSDYLRDENVEQGAHSIDTILTVAIAAAVEQGALGRLKKVEDESAHEDEEEQARPNVLEGETIKTTTPETTN